MPYAICNVVFGCPATEGITEIIDKWDAKNNTCERCGFEYFYNGGGPKNGYVGVHLMQFNEADNGIMPLEELMKVQPTEEQRIAVLAKIEALPDELRAHCDSPALYIIFGTS